MGPAQQPLGPNRLSLKLSFGGGYKSLARELKRSPIGRLQDAGQRSPGFQDGLMGTDSAVFEEKRLLRLGEAPFVGDKAPQVLMGERLIELALYLSAKLNASPQGTPRRLQLA